MATEIQLKVLFGKKSHGRKDFKKEKITTKLCLFRRYVIFDVYTHVDTEKELERVIENKRDEFCRGKKK